MEADAPMEPPGGLLDTRPLSRFQITTLLLCGTVLVLDGFAAQSIGFLAPGMADSLGVSVHTFGPVFASALFGLMLASLLAGPIADRIGRKVPIVVAALIFGVFTAATGAAMSFNQLIIFRFLTGLGLGAAIPNVVALVTEYSPRRLQHTLVTMLFCGMPLGALLGGIISTAVLPRWGWRPVFYAGGAFTFIFALLLIWALPESLEFLGLRLKHGPTIRRMQVNQEAKKTPAQWDQASVHKPQRTGATVVHLFSEGRAAGTLLLWVPFFLNLLLLYFIVNWLPALLRQTHMPWIAGIFGVSLFSMGGIIGSLLQGRVMKIFGDRLVLLVEFLCCLVLVASLAWITSFALIMVVIFAAGCFVQGAQAGINALAATFYPTSMRSTGVGWALGIGRLGSIFGPVLGGLMLSHNWSLRSIFLAGSLPALLAILAILLSVKLPSGGDPYSGSRERIPH